MADPAVTEINCNSNGSVYAERKGIKNKTAIAISAIDLMDGAHRIATSLRGVRLTPQNPTVNASLPDGSRVAIVAPPLSVGGVTMTIRKFSPNSYRLSELESFGMLRPEARTLLESAVLDPTEPANILISGGTGTGKTTLLNALLFLLVPEQPRLGIIEDVSELKISDFGNTFHLVGNADFDIRKLLREALRHTPDRLIVGEVRGAEAFDMIDAMNTGHYGSFSTIHASRAQSALSRLMLCMLKAEVTTPQTLTAIKTQIADAIDYVVQLKRLKEQDGEGRRIVSEVIEIRGYNSVTDQFDTRAVYRH